MAKSKSIKTPTKQLNFTLAALESLPVEADEYSVRASNYKGMRCRVFPSGKKLVEVVRKPKGRPNQVRVRICYVGDLPLTNHKGKPSIENKYYEINDTLLAGLNPNEERKAKDVTDSAKGVTLKDAFKQFKADSDLAPNTLTAYTNAIENHLKEWLDTPLAGITGAMVREKHKAISKDTPIAANNAMRAFRAVYNYMYTELEDENERPLLPPCPTRKLTAKGKRKGWNKEERRQGQIEPQDLKAWWQATEKIATTVTLLSGKESAFYKGGDGKLARDYLQFVILTGLRRREAAGLRWENINLRSKTFTVTETKTHKPLTLPLSPYLVELLKHRKESKNGPFPIKEVKRFVSKVRELSGLQFTVHDLRRSFIGYANDCNLGVLTIKALVNHAIESKGGDVTEGYLINTHRRLRQPMEDITDYVLRHAEVIDTTPVELRTVK